MHAESYMYRKLYSFVENCIFIKKFDYFEKTRLHELARSQEEILSLANFTRRTEKSVDLFSELLVINLWSGANDLLDDKSVCLLNRKVLEEMNTRDDCIICNDMAHVWSCLCNDNTNRERVDIVLDNGGFELFTDLILAEYIIEKGLAKKVCFHAKPLPWFASNITEDGFHSSLKYLSEHSDYIVSLIGQKFIQFVKEEKFEVHSSHFWVAPHAFSR